MDTIKQKLSQTRNEATILEGWQFQHKIGVTAPTMDKERSLVELFSGWARYAENHEARFDAKIGEDYILGVAWTEIGQALRTLLNGEIGRLDAGTLDSFLLNTAAEHGINLETGEAIETAQEKN